MGEGLKGSGMYKEVHNRYHADWEGCIGVSQRCHVALEGKGAWMYMTRRSVGIKDSMWGVMKVFKR